MTRITVINPNTSAELTATITAAAQALGLNTSRANTFAAVELERP